jgi:hypothetical protein
MSSHGKRTLALGLFAALLFISLLFTSFRRGWIGMQTDFPNYYTAARLTLQHKPLRNFYEWTWFQREINYAGIERQLGSYAPHTPLTMMPLIPLAGLPPLTAKRVWLAVNLLLLAASVWMLAGLTGFGLAETAAVTILAYGSLGENFLLGQYYVFLLFLLTCAAWNLLRGNRFTGGALLGAIFALKPYTAPFALYFAARRQWRELGGMAAAVIALALAAIAVFGFDGVWYFATAVLPRAADGSINDPYHPLFGTMTVFLRRTFATAPAAFFFLRTFYMLAVVAITLLALRGESKDDGCAFAWFLIVLFVVSPVTSSYHFVLLIVPVMLLLRGMRRTQAIVLLTLFAAVEMPLYPWDAWLFPKVWLLVALWICAGWPWWGRRPGLRRAPSPAKPLVAIFCTVALLSAADAWRRYAAYRVEPQQNGAQVIADPDGVFSSAPVLQGRSIIYEAIAQDRYLLRENTAGAIRTMPFQGEAFHPTAAESGPVYFELVSGGRSQIYAYNGEVRPLAIAEPNPREPAISRDGARLAFVSQDRLYVRADGETKRLATGDALSGPAFFPDGAQIAFAEGPPGRRTIRAVDLDSGASRILESGGDAFEPAISPDGAMLAFALSGAGSRQIWIQSLATGARRDLTAGPCNNDSPAWSADSRSLVFASDCGRGFGLPALYKLTIDESFR